MKNLKKSETLKTYTAEKAKKILMDLDNLIVEIQSAPIMVVEKVVLATRKLLPQEY